MRKGASWFLFLLVLGACSPGGRGTLVPLPAPGVTLESTQGQTNDTARLTASGVTAQVSGRWTNGNETLDVVYHAGSLPKTIPIISVSTWKGHNVAANHVWDESVPKPTNGIGESLLEAGVLHLRANETRKVLFEYDRPSLADNDRPAVDDEVTITVPMPDRAIPVRFRAAGE